MVILVTRCVSKKEIKKSFHYEFHFKGYFKGTKINQVLICQCEDTFNLKQDYLLAVEVDEIKKGTLYGSLLKYKEL
ncbi:MAG: hypothetical protein KC493_07800 [Bacteriovoracaceae bacterium]|nr:hypothetical protein [Bacteriovoracaceae bacterium]